ncbi:cation diffusion facilitator family transporter [Endozoicomonas sp. ONNA2]|uniref:cation diffusion facilitator family transporter n=1 Tax=Endozoicomonas sp. ONNA2 TaxID=2828741 RepID=UPI0021478495
MSEQKKRLLKLATYASVATASLLIIAKLIAWFMTGSMSLLATLLDSTMDILASLITLFAVRIAILPADDDHHFGHGKAEQLAVLAQSAFIGGSAIVLVLNTLDRITGEDVVLDNESSGIVVMVFSIIATLILLAIQRYVIRKTNSAAIKSDSLHYQVDLLTNVAVLAALFATRYGYHQVDNMLALLIGGYMLFSVRNLAWESIQQLMDKALPEEELQEIQKRALSVDGVLGIHDVKTRMSGSTPFIQMHLDLEPHMPLIHAHDLGVLAKRAVLEYLPEADVIVHLDPEGHDEEPQD